MSAELSFYLSDGQAAEMLLLGEILLPDTAGDLGEGFAAPVRGRNTGDTALREVSVRVEGEGRENVQLAIDADGVPGVWAAPGEPIVAHAEALLPGQEFTIWAKGVYAYEDDEQEREFRLVAAATSFGGIRG